LVAAVIAGVLVIGGWAIANQILFRQQAQPIAFPHDLHAGNRQIACQYCHRGTVHGDIAGVPSVPECMECHQWMASIKDKPEVQKLISYATEGKPIKWFKVYQLPEHVRFTHEAHIARGFDCSECHGQVQEMRVLKMARNPTMGFCLNCHRKNKAPTDCTTCHK